MRLAGVAFIVTTFGVIAVPITRPELGLSSDLSIGLAVGCMVCAAVLITLPNTAKQIEGLQVLQERGGATPLDPKESGPAEALRALRFVRDNPIALTRVILPWALLGIVPVLASLYFGSGLLTGHPGKAARASVLLMLGASILLTAATYPMVALAWARFALGQSASPFAPIRPSLAYLWRFFVLSMVVATFSKQLTPATAYLVERLHLADPKALDGLASLAGYLAILMIFGPMALSLPAIAAGEPRQASGVMMGLFRPGRRYVPGLIVAVAPFLAVNVVVEVATAYWPPAKELSPWLVLGFTPIVATYLGIATGMTYLVQIYRKMSAETDVGPYEPFVAEASE